MGLITPVAGAYTGTFTPPSGSADSLGTLHDDGYELSMTPRGQEVNDTDRALIATTETGNLN